MENNTPAPAIEELRQLVAESRASGIGKRSIGELFAEAERIAIKRGLIRDHDRAGL